MSEGDRKGRSKGSPYKVGYGQPPLHSRFAPGTSGNPKGRPSLSKLRNIRRELQQVYLQEISVGDGKTRRKMPALVLLHEKSLRDGLKGNAKAALTAMKYADQLGVPEIKDEIGIDISLLTREERDKMMEVLPLFHKARARKS